MNERSVRKNRGILLFLLNALKSILDLQPSLILRVRQRAAHVWSARTLLRSANWASLHATRGPVWLWCVHQRAAHVWSARTLLRSADWVSLHAGLRWSDTDNFCQKIVVSQFSFLNFLICLDLNYSIFKLLEFYIQYIDYPPKKTACRLNARFQRYKPLKSVTSAGRSYSEF